MRRLKRPLIDVVVVDDVDVVVRCSAIYGVVMVMVMVLVMMMRGVCECVCKCVCV